MLVTMKWGLMMGRRWGVAGMLVALLTVCGRGWGQENPLGQVHTPVAAPKAPAEEKTEPAKDGVPGASAMRVPRLRVTANLVLVPMTVTDPLNRLVTGLEAPNFEIFDNNVGQVIKSFSTEDASGNDRDCVRP